MGMMLRRNIIKRATQKVALPLTETKVEEVKNVVDFSECMNPPEVGEVTYTKTEINRMPLADLRILAESNGIENASDKSGAELKKELIKKLC